MPRPKRDNDAVLDVASPAEGRSIGKGTIMTNSRLSSSESSSKSDMWALALCPLCVREARVDARASRGASARFPGLRARWSIGRAPAPTPRARGLVVGSGSLARRALWRGSRRAPDYVPSRIEELDGRIAVGVECCAVAPTIQALHIRQGFPILPQRNRSERIALLRDVLARHPALAQAARRLPVYDQFKLTVELLRGSDWVGQKALHGVPTNNQAVHDNQATPGCGFVHVPPDVGASHPRNRRRSG
jgi:hypothetical protein